MSYLEERRKHIESGRPLKPKKIYTISKKSAKQIQKEKKQQTVIVKPKKAGWFDVDNTRVTGEGILNKAEESTIPFDINRWFFDRHVEMKGVCKNCGCKTQKGKDNYKNSIAHILPKAYFKSVATHPNNWIELCFYGKSCHTNLDNNMIDLTELSCWSDVVDKFVKMYPSIAKEERRRIPQVLLQYIETEI